MKTMDFVEVIKLNQLDLQGSQVGKLKEENITRVGTNNFLMTMLDTYNVRNKIREKLVTDDRIDEFIICNLSNNKIIAEQQWFEGIEYNGYRYFGWFATVGGMKVESTVKGGGICDSYFIREDYIEFAQTFESLISLGRFKTLEGKEICINKDVLSRISLATTDLIGAIDMPNTIVMKNGKLDWIKEYKTVKPIESITTDEEGKETRTVDYELTDYLFDTSKTDENGRTIDEIEIFDGYGIGTPKVFEEIGQSLDKKRNDIEFAIIRGYSNATKGLITKMDILGFMEEFYVGDSETCKKVNGKFYLKDMWNVWQLVCDKTVILNESMVKIAKMFDSHEHHRELLEKLNTDGNRDYYNLLSKLYISKVNKPNSKIDGYRKTNYQLINALNITPVEYKKLIEQDFNLFKKILKPYEYDEGVDGFRTNIDTIALFYRNISNVDVNDKDYKSKIYDECNNIADKTKELININEDFVKLKHTRQNLASLIQKQIENLICGRFTVKGDYQYMAGDSISYMNFLMTGNQGTNGLGQGEFYSSVCKDGDIRTVSRNPLSAYSEVHNVKFVRNELLDKYLCKSKEIIYINQKSDFNMLTSGSDLDGDAILSVDNEIIRKSVVVPKDNKYFTNTVDGETKQLEYNEQNRFESTYLASGNLIGKIALKAVSVNCNCQQVYQYYDTVEKEFLQWYDLKHKYVTVRGTEEGFKELLEQRLDEGRFVYVSEVNDLYKKKISESFYDYEKEIYVILLNGMMAIDSCKSLVFPSKEDMAMINEKYFKNANFIRYTKQDVLTKDSQFVYTNSLLDSYASKIENDLLESIKKVRNQRVTSNWTKYHKELQRGFRNDSYNEKMINQVFREVDELYIDYTRAISKTDRLYKTRQEEAHSELSGELLYYKLVELGRMNREQLREIDKEYLQVSDMILDNYDLATVSKAISMLPRCSEKFLINIFFKAFKFVNSNLNNSRYMYIEDENGTIEYMFKKYSKVEVENFDNTSVIDRLETQARVRNKIEQKVRFRLLDDSIIDDIYLNVDNGMDYRLQLNDKRIGLFDDYTEQLDGLEYVDVIKFDRNKNLDVAITKSSFGVIAKVG